MKNFSPPISKEKLIFKLNLYYYLKYFLYLLPLITSLFTTNSLAINCKLTNNFTDATVCSDTFLITLDKTITSNYNNMFNSDIGTSARNDLKITQKNWLHSREFCKSTECLIEIYKNRVNEICEYPVITGIHPICEDYEDVLKLFNNQLNEEK